jgi:FMN-dependent NADH-azoreductase
MNILQVNSSARGENSHSTRLANRMVERLLASNADATLTVRDVGRIAQPELDETALQALFTPLDKRTAEQHARVALDDALIAELQAADVLVLAVPMYNFGSPSSLKNWMDAVARAGVTFRYTEKGPIGLLSGKKIYVMLTRGGLHRDSASDSQVPHLRTFLGFLGMTDVQFVYAEGLALGEEAAQKSLATAECEIAEAVLA